MSIKTQINEDYKVGNNNERDQRMAKFKETVVLSVASTRTKVTIYNGSTE